VQNMDQETIAWLLTGFQNKSDKLKLTENEKLFIFSIGFVLRIFITSNEVDYPEEGGPYSGYYARHNIRYLVKIYNILGKRIAIGRVLKDIVAGKIEDFDYVQDVLQIFYREYLSENEKNHVKRLLNDLAKELLEFSRDFIDVRKNIDDLFDFFEIAYNITDKTFRYDKKTIFALLDTNKFDENEDFFDSLVDTLMNLNLTKISSSEIKTVFISNINNLLSANSKSFVKAMAKTLIE